jgi:NAD(P)-dependent dehydrogenase (short-subunit alcohol dehydrogenase family)
VLINNAGVNYTMPVLDGSLEDGKTVFDANFWGMLAVCQAFAPLLVLASTVVNLSSIAGCLNTPWMGTFALYIYTSISICLPPITRAIDTD